MNSIFEAAPNITYREKPPPNIQALHSQYVCRAVNLIRLSTRIRFANSPLTGANGFFGFLADGVSFTDAYAHTPFGYTDCSESFSFAKPTEGIQIPMTYIGSAGRLPDVV